MSEKHLAVRRIKDGTVIDHVRRGKALQVLSALGVTGQNGNIVTVAINVPSDRLEKKDIIKIENKSLKVDETNKIALISPRATVNIIKDYRIIEKRKVNIPDALEGVFSCPNPTCISNSGEPLTPSLKLISKNPTKLQCKYCSRLLEPDEIL